ncbi:MAG: hypothetical protein J7L34_07505 [Thermotogaceae bacterium]|nr:hypothetical protein [Thermotogaceae bacterium]
MLAFVFPKNAYASFFTIEWRSISALAGLSIITTGMQKSKIFHKVAKVWTKRLKSERSLALFLVVLSGLISTILTNDVALFITVPFTLSLGSFIKNDLSKLVIFEAMSVNVFSTLTPIGNPQNMLLWHKMDVSFFGFMTAAFPVFFIMAAILVIFTWILFSKKEIVLRKNVDEDVVVDKKLFIFSSVSLVVYIIMLQLKLNYAAFVIFLILYIVFFMDIVKNAYWTLPLIFIAISLDFHTLASLKPVKDLLSVMVSNSPRKVFTVSSISSQLISNVPATVLVINFTHNFKDILYGVNVGGNGTVISSLANIIAIDLSKDNSLWIKFHKYSLPFFLTAFSIIYTIYNVCC